MVKKHLKKSSKSLIILEKQIKSILKFHRIPVKVSKIKVIEHTGKDVDQEEHLSIANWSANICNHFGK